jgi:hypothetical protein
MHVPAIVVLFGVTGLVWLAVFPILGSARKDTWGINLHRVSCPTCGSALPILRIPASAEEARMGGWTCRQCRTRVDKWGRKLDAVGGPEDSAANG